MAIEKGSIWGKRIGQILLEKSETLTPELLDEGLEAQKKTGKLIGMQLLEMGHISEGELLEALSESFMIPAVDPNEPEVVNKEFVKLIPEGLAKRFKVIILQIRKIGDKDTIFVAMADPNNVNAIDSIKQATKIQDVQPVISLDKQIEKAIENFYSDEGDMDFNQFEDGDEVEIGGDGDEEGVDVGSIDHDAAPVVKYVNQIFALSVKERASDIHIEPYEKKVIVRFRIDGKLRQMPSPPKKWQNAIVSRIKVVSGLDIAERRIPQDGRCKIRIMNRDIDIRVSTLPVVHGEKVVMRLLDKSATSLNIDDMGMEPHVLSKAKNLLLRPYGIMILTGPTGSGKTTTLYSFLTHVNKPDVNIITVEDPVEYQLGGINQVAVRAQVGMTFAAGLRSILRQDPDIIMVGEMRDLETLEMGIKAALTGHLVFSTLHTNNAVASIQRMVNMGVEPFLISSTLTAVISQRLVRRICKACKQVTKPTDKEIEALKKQFNDPCDFQFMKGRGCPNCGGTGNRGRTACHELFFVSSTVRDMIAQGATELEVAREASREGMESIVENAFLKVKRGDISLEECMALMYDADEA